jgi:hypothetical protein
MLKKALGNVKAIQPVVALVVLIEVIITVSLRDLRAVLRKFYGGTVLAFDAPYERCSVSFSSDQPVFTRDGGGRYSSTARPHRSPDGRRINIIAPWA